MMRNRATIAIKIWAEDYHVSSAIVVTQIKTSELIYFRNTIEFSNLETYTLFALTWDPFLDSFNFPPDYILRKYSIDET
jgi:hypothetical protein